MRYFILILIISFVFCSSFYADGVDSVYKYNLTEDGFDKVTFNILLSSKSNGIYGIYYRGDGVYILESIDKYKKTFLITSKDILIDEGVMKDFIYFKTDKYVIKRDWRDSNVMTVNILESGTSYALSSNYEEIYHRMFFKDFMILQYRDGRVFKKGYKQNSKEELIYTLPQGFYVTDYYNNKLLLMSKRKLYFYDLNNKTETKLLEYDSNMLMHSAIFIDDNKVAFTKQSWDYWFWNFIDSIWGSSDLWIYDIDKKEEKFIDNSVSYIVPFR